MKDNNNVKPIILFPEHVNTKAFPTEVKADICLEVETKYDGIQKVELQKVLIQFEKRKFYLPEIKLNNQQKGNGTISVTFTESNRRYFTSFKGRATQTCLIGDEDMIFKN